MGLGLGFCLEGLSLVEIRVKGSGGCVDGGL